MEIKKYQIEKHKLYYRFKVNEMVSDEESKKETCQLLTRPVSLMTQTRFLSIKI